MYCILLIEKGSLAVNIYNKKLMLISPCVLMIKENTTITSISPETIKAKVIGFDVSFLNINITYDIINSGEYGRTYEKYGFIPLNIFFEERDNFYRNLCLSRNTFNRLQSLFISFKNAVINQTDPRWSCKARLTINVILELIHQIYLEYITHSHIVYDIKSPNTWVSLLLDKIHSNYMNPISLDTLSRDIGINKSSINKYFRSITGTSVTKYIIDYRIKCSCYSLSTTNITLKEISQECGFSTESYFVRQFKNRMGITPREYRNSCFKKREYFFDDI